MQGACVSIQAVIKRVKVSLMRIFPKSNQNTQPIRKIRSRNNHKNLKMAVCPRTFSYFRNSVGILPVHRLKA